MHFQSWQQRVGQSESERERHRCTGIQTLISISIAGRRCVGGYRATGYLVRGKHPKNHRESFVIKESSLEAKSREGRASVGAARECIGIDNG